MSVPDAWIAIAISGAIHYAAALRIRFGGIDRLAADERETVPFVTSASAAAFFAALVWKLAPGDYLGVAFLTLGALLFELGLRNLPRHFRWQSYLVSLLGFSHLFYFHVMQAEKGAAQAEWLSLTLAALICYAVSARLLRVRDRRPERGWCRDLNAAAGTLFVLTLAWVELPDVLVGAGLGRGQPGAARSRIQCFAGAFSHAWKPDRGGGIRPIVPGQLHRLRQHRGHLTSHLDGGSDHGRAVLRLVALPAMPQGWERSLARLYLYAPAILGVVLLRFELGRSLAVVGWALFGLALYRTGLVRDLDLTCAGRATSSRPSRSGEAGTRTSTFPKVWRGSAGACSRERSWLRASIALSSLLRETPTRGAATRGLSIRCSRPCCWRSCCFTRSRAAC